MSARFADPNITFDFAPTQFIIDDNYVGDPPRVQVSFENLNDNIDENFLRRDLKNYKLKTLEIVRHPYTKQHLGLAKIQFEDPREAQHCADFYNGKQVMGKKLSVYIDVRYAMIERKKEEILNPKPITLPTTIIERLPTISPATPSSITTASTAFVAAEAAVTARGSLEDRIAMLMQQPSCVLSSIPGMPRSQPPQQQSPPAISQVFQPNNEVNKPFDSMNRHNNHINKQYGSAKSFDKMADGHRQPTLPPVPKTQSREEEDSAWNPVYADRDQGEVEKKKKEEKVDELMNLVLTVEQVDRELIPACFERLMDELEDNCHLTICRKLGINTGYKILEDFRMMHQDKQKEIRREEETRLQTERQKQQNREWERRFMTKARIENAENIARPRANIIRQRTTNDHDHTSENRRPALDLKRVNRSSAFVDEPDRLGSRHASVDSHSIDSRQSRSTSRSLSNSRSSSACSTSSMSSRSSSCSESSSSSSGSSPSSLSSSQSSSSSSSSTAKPAPAVLDTESFLIRRPAERAALEGLIALGDAAQAKQEPKKEKFIGKKRKLKDEPSTDAPKKARTKESNEEGPKPTFTFDPRPQSEIEKLLYDVYSINDEDIGFIQEIHEEYNKKLSDAEHVEFGSVETNKSHILSFSHIEREKKEDKYRKHPKWWNGCSRCSVIDIKEKGQVTEEPEKFEDLTMAPIKSHVILAASTRRDQRSDQRRIAALNPEIDPSFLKQFTSNTLQMRAKNLRFSRSKIHKWGLFACEKIANGDAVIEYVGEKIRPSLADHREKHVYTNLPTHDGSSYFFRVDTDVIDATLKGNKARFINHCCNPNCIAKVIRHENGTNSIVIYAKQTINEDEEITYDYKFPREEQKIRCECKAPNCQKFLN